MFHRFAYSGLAFFLDVNTGVQLREYRILDVFVKISSYFRR